jgi:hypothetical protein
VARKKLPKQFRAVKKKHADGRATEISDAELQDAITGEQVKVVKKRQRGVKQEVSMKEMKNVIADTLERLGFGQDSEKGRLNNEEYWAHNIVMAMRYGINDDGRLRANEPDIDVLEHEYDEIPYCEEHS